MLFVIPLGYCHDMSAVENELAAIHPVGCLFVPSFYLSFLPYFDVDRLCHLSSTS